MSQSILTNALSAYKAEQEAAGLPVILDEFIFALIPGLDPETPIDPNETIPPEAQIQGRFPVSAKGVINPDAVVYSIILGTDIGTWNFNAIYLVNKDLNLAGAIIHTIEQTKEKADPTSGIEGDTLTRNIVTPYTNAAELTQIIVSADTWQLDFNNRLSAMDERVRKNNVTEYGNAAFFDDGWKVNHTAGETSLTIDPGLGYVGGLQSVNDSLATLDLTDITLPKTVYLISSFEGTVSGAWNTRNQIEIVDSFPEKLVLNGVTFYSAPLALLSSTENAKDLRKPNTDTEFVRKDNAATDDDIDNESQAEKHVNLPQFWRGIEKYVLEKLWLGLAKKICPVGVPLPWPTDIAPDGFGIMKGQGFDPKYTETLKAYPLGILDDMRGLAVVGKEDGELILAYEEDQVKEHGHDGSVAESTDLGTKTTNTTGNHAHTYSRSNASGGGNGVNRYAINGNASTSTTGNHSHTVAIGSHAHAVIVAMFGALKNTIRNRKFNWIVRLA